MATKKVKRFDQGGIAEAEDKARGLEASKDDKVGFFERLRMGNIDDPNSEAYRRFGAGRGRNNFEITPAREPAEYRADPYGDMTQSQRDARQSSEEIDSMNRGREQGKRQPSGDASVAEMYQGPQADMRPGGRPHVNVTVPAKTAASKPAASKAPAMQEQTYTRRGGATADDRASSPRVAPASNPNYSNEGRSQAARGKSLVDQIPRDTDMPTVKGERTSGSDLSRNVANTALALGPGKLAGIGAIGVEMRGAEAARKAAAAKKTADRTRELREKGQPTKFTSTPKVTNKNPAKKTKKFDDSESNIEFKRGGKAYASGGSVSAASKRADGIAARGKTRCKIC